jgi:hypothetical protein
MRAWVVVLSLWAASAVAEPLPAKNAEDVRVSVANKSRHAFALKPLAAGGWQLELGADAERADLIDVTPGTPARTLTVPVVARAVRFDAVRFVGGHVYHLSLRAGARVASGFVYLHPATAAKERPRGRAERVRFDPDDAPADDGTNIGRVDKGSL